MSESILERWEKRQKKEESVHEIERKASREEEDIRRKEITEAIEGVFGCTPHTNGYWYTFNWGGFHIYFVDQTTRWCGKIHKELSSDPEVAEKEAIMLQYLHFLGRDEEKKVLVEEIKREYAYQDFILESFSTRANLAKIKAKCNS